MTTPVYIEQTVTAALKASAQVAALVADRVYPVKIPQGAVLPAVTYQRTDSSPDYTLQGYGSETVTLTLNSLAPTYEQAKELAIAVRAVMTAAPIRAIVRKEVDLKDACELCPMRTSGARGAKPSGRGKDEKIEAPCVSTEYLVQQSGGHHHGCDGANRQKAGAAEAL